MRHVEIVNSPKDLINKVNNYEPYTYRVLYKDKTYSKWEKPKHSFIKVDENSCTAGCSIFKYGDIIEIEFRVYGTKGKEEYCFKLNEKRKEN